VIRKPLPAPRWRAASGAANASWPTSPSRFRSAAPGNGEDLFSQLCRATHDDGALLSTQDIVDHMSFLMMAAHDTLTSSLTSFVAELAANPQWQTRLRDEVANLGIAADQPTTFDNLEAMAAVRDGVQGSHAGCGRRCPRSPAAPSAISPSRATRCRPAPCSASIRSIPITCPRSWPDPEKIRPLAL